MATRFLFAFALIIFIVISIYTANYIFTGQWINANHIKVHNMDILPWDPFDIDIFEKVNELQSNIINNIPQNTNEYLVKIDNQVIIIHNITNIDIGYNWIPIGIPSFNKSIWFNDSFISHDPNWKICLIYSMNTYLAGLTMFNRFHYYSFYMQHTDSNTKCYRNKITRSIVDSLYFNKNKSDEPE